MSNAKFGAPEAVLALDADGAPVHGSGQVRGACFNRAASLLVSVDDGEESAIALWDTQQAREGEGGGGQGARERKGERERARARERMR